MLARCEQGKQAAFRDERSWKSRSGKALEMVEQFVLHAFSVFSERLLHLQIETA